MKLKRKKQSKARNKSNYIDNEKLLEEVIKYQKEVKKANGKFVKVSDELAKYFLLIAHNLASKGNFISYTWKDEMISDGIENCLRSVGKFNPSKGSNAFAYFSTIIFYAFVRRIKLENKQLYCKYKSFLCSDLMNDDEVLTIIQNHDNFKEHKLEFIDRFEKSMIKKNKKVVDD